jgi:hypothetical protein
MKKEEKNGKNVREKGRKGEEERKKGSKMVK